MVESAENGSAVNHVATGNTMTMTCPWRITNRVWSYSQDNRWKDSEPFANLCNVLICPNPKRVRCFRILLDSGSCSSFLTIRPKFPATKSLDTFDFLAIPSLNKKLVLDLARCEWIHKSGKYTRFREFWNWKDAHCPGAWTFCLSSKESVCDSQPRRPWFTN